MTIYVIGRRREGRCGALKAKIGGLRRRGAENYRVVMVLLLGRFEAFRIGLLTVVMMIA